MRQSNRNYAFTTEFVDALAGLGLRHVCITPGSRNSPLALAFADHHWITDWIHHDERSSAFFALGLANASRRPVAVTTTSGTAAAELHPAAVEAHLARIPLLLLTADRPPELRDVGAPQAINQTDLFGKSAKWFHEVAIPDPLLGNYPSTLASRAWAAALDLPAGPVHLNFPFREPLAPLEVPGDVAERPATGPPPAYVPGRLEIDHSAVEGIAGVVSGRRALLIAGPLDRPGFPAAVTTLAKRAGFPLVADPLSQLRAGDHDRTRVITTGDPLARAGKLDGVLKPEFIIRFGAIPTSKTFSTWLADHSEIPQYVIDDAGWRDPGGSAATMVRSDPLWFARQLVELVKPAPADWAADWTAAENAAREALNNQLAFPSEPAVVAVLADAIPDETTLYVASSMPIRDVDAFFPSIDRRVRILSNRGANGIDGLISSGLGAAAEGRPVLVLSGDLSLLHDLTALGTAARFDLPVTIVVINNDGGGIFHFLPQAAFPEHFERLLGTPHGTDFQAAADLFGIDYHLVESETALNNLVATAAQHPRLVEIRTNRVENVAIHERAWRAVATGY
jgi:2-succinyl-5-enolpyruvyl-6-hydroxy-3-cyclohexene-1-carboxylate synthase